MREVAYTRKCYNAAHLRVNNLRAVNVISVIGFASWLDAAAGTSSVLCRHCVNQAIRAYLRLHHCIYKYESWLKTYGYDSTPYALQSQERSS
jgi:hypothetical protein